jgi:hypothetical protein
MAKKIRKTRMTTGRVFILLIIPWAVMGAVALAAFAAGAPDYVAIILALAGSLLVTYVIRERLPKTRGR